MKRFIPESVARQIEDADQLDDDLVELLEGYDDFISATVASGMLHWFLLNEDSTLTDEQKLIVLEGLQKLCIELFNDMKKKIEGRIK